MNLLLPEQFAFTTARIEATLKTGEKSIGTGFFFSFLHSESAENTNPVLITNKHVVEDAESITFHMTRSSSAGEPVIGDFVQLRIKDIAARTINHPDTDVDLCAFLVGPLLNEANLKGQPFFYRHLTQTMIATPDELVDLVALDDVIMVGYPIGLWDAENNMPIFRRGVTATHPYLDYNGRKEFLVDMACFPGSSGSPVFLYNPNGYRSRDGNYHIDGQRIKLLGTLYAGPVLNTQGELQIVPAPTASKAVAISPIPINVGVVIKAERILELATIVESFAGTIPAGAAPDPRV